MILEQHAWYHHALGGAMIGGASVLLMWGIGKIAGVSSILSGALEGCVDDHPDWEWQLAFIIGLVAPGVYFSVYLETGKIQLIDNQFLLAVAGLCVGFGVRFSRGCTSGHGVCGIGNLSIRSIVATITFMASAIATVALV